MMTYDQVWQFLRGMKGQRLATLDQHKAFTLDDVTAGNLIVRGEATGYPRAIPRSQVEEAWNRLSARGKLARTEIARDISRFNPAYVASLLAKIPGVNHTVSPIVLTVSRDVRAQPQPKDEPEAAASGADELPESPNPCFNMTGRSEPSSRANSHGAVRSRAPSHQCHFTALGRCPASPLHVNTCVSARIQPTPADILVDGRNQTMSARREHGAAETIHLTEQTFDETLARTQGLVMVDFWAEWCGPCRAIAPVLEELAEASEGRVTLMKVNVDENHALAARYEIRSIPTILFFKEGVVVDRVVGAVPRTRLLDIVNARA